MNRPLHSFHIHTTYTTITTALSYAGNLIDEITRELRTGSSQIILDMDELAHRHGRPVGESAYFSALTGPAPLMSLRTALATVNGLAYAYHIPCVPLPTFAMLLSEERATPACVLVNAFCGEMYYAMYSPEGAVVQGSATPDRVASLLAAWRLTQTTTPLLFLVDQIGHEFLKQHPTLVTADDIQTFQHTPSLAFALSAAHEAWEHNQITPACTPVYLKAAV